jgi:putative transcriptional regulator
MVHKQSSKILKTVHATAAGLHEAGAIGQTTMRKFDALCIKRLNSMRAAKTKRI